MFGQHGQSETCEGLSKERHQYERVAKYRVTFGWVSNYIASAYLPSEAALADRLVAFDMATVYISSRQGA
eukprot:scaffold46401_cov19-Prasinocladus_malaysianus.AAC.1